MPNPRQGLPYAQAGDIGARAREMLSFAPALLGRDVRFGSCVTSASSRILAALNCTRDKGGPFEFGNQVLISSHRKLLRSRTVVVSVAETPGR